MHWGCNLVSFDEIKNCIFLRHNPVCKKRLILSFFLCKTHPCDSNSDATWNSPLQYPYAFKKKTNNNCLTKATECIYMNSIPVDIMHSQWVIGTSIGKAWLLGTLKAISIFLPSWRRPLSCFWRRQSVLSPPWLGHRRKTGLVPRPHCTCSVSRVHQYAAQINKGISIHNKVKCMKRLHISQTLIHKINH